MFIRSSHQTLHFDLPLVSPIYHLRSLLINHFSSPFYLIHAGAIISDDSAPLSAYSINHDSSIFLVPLSSISNPVNPSESALRALIAAELTHIRSSLTPQVHSFFTVLHDITSRPPTSSQYARIGELLLQSLLRLDALAPQQHWQDARQDRKDAVKEVQTLLDRLDIEWNSR